MTPSLLALLQQIEQQLKADSLWSSEQPTAEQLASTQPFAIDTLEISQWLQFIFVPKIRLMAETQQPLPANMQITPIIEQSYKGDQAAMNNIIERIEAICAAKIR